MESGKECNYKNDRAGLPVPPPPATLGVLPPKRRCKQRMIPVWLSGHVSGQRGHPASDDLPKNFE